MKVKIVKSFSEYAWYKDKIGETFNVLCLDKFNSFYQLSKEDFNRLSKKKCEVCFYIKKSDCEVLSE